MMHSVAASAAVGQGSLVLRHPCPSPSRYKSYPARTSANLTLASKSSSLKPVEHKNSSSFGGTSIIPDLASAFSINDQDGPSKRCKSTVQPRAFMGFPLNLSQPESNEKLVWWWRTLACIPYLLALQLSTVGFFLTPVLENHQLLENLIYYIPGALTRLPTWFAMSYNMLAYCGLVRNKKLPHFFRYHLIMAMLLETAMGVVWHGSNFLPLIFHGGGRFAEQYWAAVAVGFIAVVSGCVVSAISGKFCNIPFFSDAAMIHTKAS